MRVTTAAALGMVVLTGAWALGSLTVSGQGNSNRIAMLDDCDPTDTTFPPPACVKRGGDVTLAEFNALLTTGLGPSLIGHPSWRNEPSHLTSRAGRKITISNDGGRGHTFTPVSAFGGGTIAQLNVGLSRADGCPASPANLAVVPPGSSTEITLNDQGLQRFQCCIHPWMRATIRVE